MTADRVLIPLTRPSISEDEALAAAEAVRAGWLIQGPRVAAFEDAIAHYVGARHAVAVTNCTAALHLALRALEVGAGDEVIVPSFAFVATANVVVHTGATPVFADIDPRTYTLDPDAVEAAITPRTRAIIPVDQHGLPADLEAIHSLGLRYGAAVIEDASPALGAAYRGQRVGAIGPATCFSFQAHNLITTGEGGMIATDDGALAGRLRRLRAHGASLGDPIRLHVASLSADEYDTPGYNYRMTDIQAAVGLAQVERIDRILERRRTRAERYTRLLADLPGITSPYAPPETRHAYQSYAVRLDAAIWPARDAVIEQMLARGIGARRGIMATHLEPYYRRHLGRVHLPATEEAARQTMLLPLFAAMSEEEQDLVVDALRDILRREIPRRPTPAAPATGQPKLALLHGSGPRRAGQRRDRARG